MRPAALDPNPQAAIAEMVRRIVERFDPDKIILFGSYARGDARPDSDVDLLVVMPVETTRREKAAEILASLAGILMPKDVIVATPERASSAGFGVVGSAVREGKLVYQRHG